MARASRNDRRVLVRGVVSTLMLLAVEVPMHATLSMGVGGVIKDGCIGRSDVVGCCIDVRQIPLIKISGNCLCILLKYSIIKRRKEFVEGGGVE